MLDSSHKTIATGVVLKVGKGLHAFGVDEAAGARVALWQIAFSGWVTLSARKWVISRERRGSAAGSGVPALGRHESDKHADGRKRTRVTLHTQSSRLPAVDPRRAKNGQR